MPLTFTQRKTIEINWDEDEIKGQAVSISVKRDTSTVELRNVDNDGHATVTFPQAYSGDCVVVVRGSKGGEQTETVKVV